MDNQYNLEIESINRLINKNKIVLKSGLNKQEKINFAYDYWNLSNGNSLEDLFIIISENRQKLDTNNSKELKQNKNYIDIQFNLFRFMNMQRDYWMQRINKGKIHSNEIETIKKALEYYKNNPSWLSLYDIDEEFKINPNKKYKFPVNTSYIINGNEVKINYNVIEKILSKLNSNNIPIANCIVKESFHQYALGELDQYMLKLHKNDNDITKIKKEAIKKINKLC